MPCFWRGLLEALFAEGVCLVATSNVEPENLYRNGLQRGRFLPAIDLLNIHTEVLHLQTKTDYRLRTLQKAGVYFHPNTPENEQAVKQCFLELTHFEPIEQTPISINDRQIQTLAIASEVIWFDFQALCSVPRSQMDYLEIAKMYHTVLLSNVPRIAASDVTAATYFINLIDVFYDSQVKLILMAESPLDEIYPSGPKAFEFERTKSRLEEMQSVEYLHKPHLAQAE